MTEAIEAASRRILEKRRMALLVGIIGTAMAYGYYWTYFGTLRTAEDGWRLVGSGLALVAAGYAAAKAAGRCPSCGRAIEVPDSSSQPPCILTDYVN